MLVSNKSLARLVSAAAVLLFFVGNSSAQTDVNKVVVAQTSGSSMYISIDHSALSLFNDSTIARLNPDGDGEWNTWKDALTNGNSPGMDVDFDGWSAIGMLNLTATGTGTFGSTISAATGSTIGNLTLANGSITDSSGSLSFGDENLSTTGTWDAGNTTITGDLDVSGATGVDGDFDVATNKFTVAAATGNTAIAGTLTVADAATFTGSVAGPKATASNEFVTFEQLDSLASVAPFNETYRLFKASGTPQTVTTGSSDGLVLSGFGTDIYTEISDQAAAQTLQLPFSVQASVQGGGLQVIALSDAGVYESQLTMEVEHNGPGASDVYVLVELYNYDSSQGNGLPLTRVLAADASVLPSAATYGAAVPAHFNMSMTFIADNVDEEVYAKITPIGGDIDIVAFGFSVARKGEHQVD